MKKAKATLLEMRDMGVAAEPTDWLLQEVKKAQAYVVCGCRCCRRLSLRVSVHAVPHTHAISLAQRRYENQGGAAPRSRNEPSDQGQGCGAACRGRPCKSVSC